MGAPEGLSLDGSLEECWLVSRFAIRKGVMVFDHPAVDSLRILSFIVSERSRWPGDGGMQASTSSWLLSRTGRRGTTKQTDASSS